MMQFCFGRERERGCQWTLHTEGGGEGRGEMRNREKRKKKELTQYPNTVDGNIAESRRVVKMEVFILISFLFLFFFGKTSVLGFSSRDE